MLRILGKTDAEIMTVYLFILLVLEGFFCRSLLTLLLVLSRFSGKENELMLFKVLYGLVEALEPCINLEMRKCFRRLHLLRIPKIAVNFLRKEAHSYSTFLLSMS